MTKMTNGRETAGWPVIGVGGPETEVKTYSHNHSIIELVGAPSPGRCVVCERDMAVVLRWTCLAGQMPYYTPAPRCPTSISQANVPCPCHGAGMSEKP